MKWWSCVVSNKRGRVSALLGPHQHALVSMLIFDDHAVKRTAGSHLAIGMAFELC